MQKALLLVPMFSVLAACPGGRTGVKRPYPDVTAADVVARMDKLRAERKAFTAESTMDYWLGKDRVKGTVLVMGTEGRKVRFNALSPAGGNVLADMACDGTNFAYVDQQNNCQLTGPCNRSSIASLLHVEVEPDDFLAFATGIVPNSTWVMPMKTAITPDEMKHTETMSWDQKSGHEKLLLTGPRGSQSVELDLRDGKLDVIASEFKDPSGKVMWSVEFTDFGQVPDATGNEHRLPGKTRFKSPVQNADLIVDWGERTLNPDLSNPAKFQVSVPAGLPVCGPK